MIVGVAGVGAILDACRCRFCTKESQDAGPVGVGGWRLAREACKLDHTSANGTPKLHISQRRKKTLSYQGKRGA